MGDINRVPSARVAVLMPYFGGLLLSILGTRSFLDRLVLLARIALLGRRDQADIDDLGRSRAAFLGLADGGTIYRFRLRKMNILLFQCTIDLSIRNSLQNKVFLTVLLARTLREGQERKQQCKLAS